MSAPQSPIASSPAEGSPDFVIRRLTEPEYSRWEALLQVSPQATLFHSPRWLEATGVPFGLFGCFRGDELRAGFAVGTPEPGVAGHPAPALTPYLGILLPPAGDRVVTSQSTTKAVTTAVAAFLKSEFRSIHLRFPPEVVDLQPFIWQGFQAGVRYTYRLRLDDLERVLADMDATRRRNLRAAEKEGVTITSGAPLSAVLDLAARTFGRQGKTADFGDSALRIESALSASNCCRAFVATNRDGHAVGGVWIVWDRHRAYYLVGGYDDSASSSNATALAMWTAIQYTAKELGLPEFDFEGSMVPAVERFFRKFGGTLLPTYTIAMTPTASLATRLTRKARRLVARD